MLPSCVSKDDQFVSGLREEFVSIVEREVLDALHETYEARLRTPLESLDQVCRHREVEDSAGGTANTKAW